MNFFIKLVLTSSIIVLISEISKRSTFWGGVEKVLIELKKANYKIVLATKGDLVDQERKLKKSNLEKYFDHVEVMSDKKEADYLKLAKKLAISPEELLMVGNSLKSDILPVVNLGGSAVHIPFHTTWAHEEVDTEEIEKSYHTVEKIEEVLEILKF
jgi:putative hydrolase of the HAD superfamily